MARVNSTCVRAHMRSLSYTCVCTGARIQELHESLDPKSNKIGIKSRARDRQISGRAIIALSATGSLSLSLSRFPGYVFLSNGTFAPIYIYSVQQRNLEGRGFDRKSLSFESALTSGYTTARCRGPFKSALCVCVFVVSLDSFFVM